MTEVPTMDEVLKEAPKNWGKWGPDDEVGGLNYLTPGARSSAAVRHIKSGKVFTLQVAMGDPEGDPVWPGRRGGREDDDLGRGHGIGDKAPAVPGWPALRRRLHHRASSRAPRSTTPSATSGTTARSGTATTPSTHDRRPGQGQRGCRSPSGASSGRGILLDIARFRGKESLDKAETFTHEDLVACRRSAGRRDREARHPGHPHGLHHDVLQGQARGVLRGLRASPA